MKLTHPKIARALENGQKVVLKQWYVTVEANLYSDEVIVSLSRSGQWVRHFNDGSTIKCVLTYQQVQSSQWEILT